jgi:hypothetical protein
MMHLRQLLAVQIQLQQIQIATAVQAAKAKGSERARNCLAQEPAAPTIAKSLLNGVAPTAQPHASQNMEEHRASSPLPAVPVTFITQFKASYSRNHGQCQQKNLRCFPRCKHGIHKNKGACGNAIQVQCDTAEVSEPLLVVGRFEWANSRSISVGDKVNTDTIKNDLVSDQNKQGEWWLGHQLILGQTYSTTFEFNPHYSKMGWHFGGKLSRFSRVAHRFVAYFCFPSDGHTAYCIGKATSPNFQIFSRQKYQPVNAGSTVDTSKTWTESLASIKEMKTKSGKPIRDAIRAAISAMEATGIPPDDPRLLQLVHSISKAVYKRNSAYNTKNLALEVLESDIKTLSALPVVEPQQGTQAATKVQIKSSEKRNASEMLCAENKAQMASGETKTVMLKKKKRSME